jgi:hypothetical protein
MLAPLLGPVRVLTLLLQGSCQSQRLAKSLILYKPRPQEVEPMGHFVPSRRLPSGDGMSQAVTLRWVTQALSETFRLVDKLHRSKRV